MYLYPSIYFYNTIGHVPLNNVSTYLWTYTPQYSIYQDDAIYVLFRIRKGQYFNNHSKEIITRKGCYHDTLSIFDKHETSVGDFSFFLTFFIKWAEIQNICSPNTIMSYGEKNFIRAPFLPPKLHICDFHGFLT